MVCPICIMNCDSVQVCGRDIDGRCDATDGVRAHGGQGARLPVRGEKLHGRLESQFCIHIGRAQCKLCLACIINCDSVQVCGRDVDRRRDATDGVRAHGRERRDGEGGELGREGGYTHIPLRADIG